MQKGKFIIFEGMDYSGKTTTLKNFCKLLEEKNIPYITTREPGGTKMAERIRGLLLSLDESEPSLDVNETATLFQIARSHHCKTVIKPALDSGIWVISDRYIISSMVYQNDAKELIKETSKVFGILEPDAMIYTTCGYEETLRRKGIRGTDNHLDELYTKHYKEFSKLFDYYAYLLEDMSLILNTNNDMQELTTQMRKFISEILGDNYV